jgi:TATA-box binding protein (TBP) (component of TFIID and TFIIIB)
MEQTIVQQNAHFATVLDDFVNKATQPLQFEVPRVCMITMVFSLNIKNVNLDEVADNSNLVIRTQKRHKNSKKKYQSFYNSLTVLFDRTKAIKVFRNGSLHVTGCITVAHAYDIVKRFIKTMDWQDTNVSDYKIITHNTCIALSPKTTLCLQSFHEYLLSKDIKSRYTPDVYQGLIIKTVCPETDKRISILCFYTGRFIISAVTQPCELIFGLEFMTDLLADVAKNNHYIGVMV